MEKIGSDCLSELVFEVNPKNVIEFLNNYSQNPKKKFVKAQKFFTNQTQKNRQTLDMSNKQCVKNNV